MREGPRSHRWCNRDASNPVSWRAPQTQHADTEQERAETIHGLVNLSLSIGRGRSHPEWQYALQETPTKVWNGSNPANLRTSNQVSEQAMLSAWLEGWPSKALFDSSLKMDMDGRRRGVPRGRNRGQVHQPDWPCHTCGSICRFLHFATSKNCLIGQQRRIDHAGTWRAVSLESDRAKPRYDVQYV